MSIERKKHIKDRIESVATMTEERWEQFGYMHFNDIGEILKYLYNEIKELREK